MRLRARWKKQTPWSLAKSDGKPANLGRAQSAFRANLRPHFQVRLDVEIRQAAVLGFLRPFVNALEFLGLGRREQIAGLLHRLLQTARAEIIRAAFEHREVEFPRQNLREHRQILFRELLLQIDGVGGDNRFLFLRHREQNRRNQIGQRFADARAGLDREMLAVLERARHGHGHFLLLRAKFKILRPRQQPRRRENLLDLGNQVCAGGLMFGGRNHGTQICRRVGSPTNKKSPESQFCRRFIPG